MDDCRYTISDLVDRTGVPAATIHFYRTAGLLPDAVQAARNRFLYGEQHVQAVKLIRLLRERRRLPLEVIRQVLPELLEGDQEAFRPEALVESLVDRDPRAESHDTVVSAAARLFGSRGFTDVSIADIAAAAGVAKGTVYRHVSSKEDLFFAAVDAAVEDTLRRFTVAAAEHGPVLDVAAASKLLTEAIRPALPLLLELAARAAQGHAGHPTAAGRVLDALLTGIGAHVSGTASVRERGAQTLQAVIVDAFRAAVPPDDPIAS
ncbi:MAG TPA: TetR family transcriptional regulator [Acidimicrobiales bacterium]